MAHIRQKNSARNLTAAAFLAGLVGAGTGGEWSAVESKYGYAVPGLEFISSGRVESNRGEGYSSAVRESFEAIIVGLQTSSANLARVLDVSRTTVYNWMKGVSFPSREVRQRLTQLEKAAVKLSAAGIPAKSALALPIHQEMSFWDAFAANGDVEKMVERIIDYRGDRSSQQKLVAERLAAKRKSGRLVAWNDDHLS